MTSSAVSTPPQRRTRRHAQIRRRQKNEPRPPQTPPTPMIFPTILLPHGTTAKILTPEERAKVKAVVERQSKTEALLRMLATQGREIFHVVAQDGAKIPIVNLPISKSTNTFEISDLEDDDSEDDDDGDDDDDDGDSSGDDGAGNDDEAEENKENMPFNNRRATQAINNMLGRTNSPSSSKFSPAGFTYPTSTIHSNDGRPVMTESATAMVGNASFKKHNKGKKSEINIIRTAIDPGVNAKVAAADRQIPGSVTSGSSTGTDEDEPPVGYQIGEFQPDKKKRRTDPRKLLAQALEEEAVAVAAATVRAGIAKSNGSISKRQAAANAGKTSLNVMAPEFIPPGLTSSKNTPSNSGVSTPVRGSSPLPVGARISSPLPNAGRANSPLPNTPRASSPLSTPIRMNSPLLTPARVNSPLLVERKKIMALLPGDDELVTNDKEKEEKEQRKKEKKARRVSIADPARNPYDFMNAGYARSEDGSQGGASYEPSGDSNWTEFQGKLAAQIADRVDAEIEKRIQSHMAKLAVESKVERRTQASYEPEVKIEKVIVKERDPQQDETIENLRKYQIELEGEMNAVKLKHLGLQKQLFEADILKARNGELEAQFNAIKRRNAELEKKNAELEQAHNKNQELEDLSAQLHQLRSKTVELERDKDKLDQLIARNLWLEIEMEGHTAELNKLSKRNEELQSEARKNQHEMNRLLARNQEIETEGESLQLELDQLSKRNEELEDDNERMRSDEDELIKQATDLMTRNKELESEKNGLTSKNAKLESENVSQHAELHQLKIRYRELENEKKTVLDELALRNQDVETRSQRIEELWNRCQMLDKKKVETEEIFKKLESEKKKVEDQLAVKDRQVSQLVQQSNTDTARLEDLYNRYCDTERQNTQLIEQQKESLMRAQDFEQRTGQLLQENREHHAKYQDLERDHTKLTQQHRDLQFKFQELDREHQKISQKERETHPRFQELERENAKLSSQLREEKSKIDDVFARYQRLEADNAKLSKSQQEEKARYDDVYAKFQKLERENASMRQKSRDDKTKADEMLTRLQTLEKENAALLKQHKDDDNKIDDIHTKYTNVENEVERVRKAVLEEKARQEELRERNAQHESEIATLRKARDEFKDKLSAIEKENERLIAVENKYNDFRRRVSHDPSTPEYTSRPASRQDQTDYRANGNNSLASPPPENFRVPSRTGETRNDDHRAPSRQNSFHHQQPIAVPQQMNETVESSTTKEDQYILVPTSIHNRPSQTVVKLPNSSNINGVPSPVSPVRSQSSFPFPSVQTQHQQPQSSPSPRPHHSMTPNGHVQQNYDYGSRPSSPKLPRHQRNRNQQRENGDGQQYRGDGQQHRGDGQQQQVHQRVESLSRAQTPQYGEKTLRSEPMRRSQSQDPRASRSQLTPTTTSLQQPAQPVQSAQSAQPVQTPSGTPTAWNQWSQGQLANQSWWTTKNEAK
ncbi:hypothetical protein BC937DRAFT_88006 [Endogone sp. FLAS-F59071]|nr:hypothetical protein BC937DRAFT_88006 [Endogone sp. FLAS-F59071]|eukprot:RUS19089.1 hypothetical protein BC937DRAFT_88006 [Endogone sp. FLAS-F59071]